MRVGGGAAVERWVALVVLGGEKMGIDLMSSCIGGGVMVNITWLAAASGKLEEWLQF